MVRSLPRHAFQSCCAKTLKTRGREHAPNPTGRSNPSPRRSPAQPTHLRRRKPTYTDTRSPQPKRVAVCQPIAAAGADRLLAAVANDVAPGRSRPAATTTARANAIATQQRWAQWRAERAETGMVTACSRYDPACLGSQNAVVWRFRVRLGSAALPASLRGARAPTGLYAGWQEAQACGHVHVLHPRLVACAGHRFRGDRALPDPGGGRIGCELRSAAVLVRRAEDDRGGPDWWVVAQSTGASVREPHTRAAWPAADRVADWGRAYAPDTWGTSPMLWPTF
jgi:hypothetical protein